ncbi:hypothetical protein [Allofustis seminis]|uniref:hypothetical protein n=1 Tax=Allofustis seminis TaxID=166939 RepID=UPI000365243B
MLLSSEKGKKIRKNFSQKTQMMQIHATYFLEKAAKRGRQIADEIVDYVQDNSSDSFGEE